MTSHCLCSRFGKFHIGVSVAACPGVAFHQNAVIGVVTQAFRDARQAPATAVARIQALIARDIDDLVPTLEKIAGERLLTVSAQLVNRGEQEARSLADLLEQQRSRIGKAAKEFNPDQLTLDLVPEERRERAKITRAPPPKSVGPKRAFSARRIGVS